MTLFRKNWFNSHTKQDIIKAARTPVPGAAAAGSSAGDRQPCSRIRSQARVISSGIRQLMVCSRILCRIRNTGSGDQDTGSGSSCGRILCRRSAARTASTGSGCHFLRLQARKQAVSAAGRINSQANGHRQPEQTKSDRI